MIPTQRNVKYVLFDMDGLLLDTERVYSEVTSEIVGRYGKEYTWIVKSKLMGRKEFERKLINSRKAAKILIAELDIPMTPQEYLDERNMKHEAKFPGCRPLPGVERLVRHLKKHKIPIAVATSSSTKPFHLKTANNQHLFSLFDIIVCGDDPAVAKGKPHPDLFLEAARRLGKVIHDGDKQDRSDCLVFEDAGSGVQAALSANMLCVWVPDVNLPINEDPELNQLQSIVTEIARPDITAFRPQDYGLPAFSDVEDDQ